MHDKRLLAADCYKVLNIKSITFFLKGWKMFAVKAS